MNPDRLQHYTSGGNPEEGVGGVRAVPWCMGCLNSVLTAEELFM